MKGTWQLPIQPPAVQTGPASFRLAVGDREVLSAVGWEHPYIPKLWLYNLHYFDDLNADGASTRRKWHLNLISRWIAENPPFEGIGWNSYPTACRIANWIKWAIGGEQLPPDALASLALQVRYLRRNLEWRLMGNRLFADIKALIMAGCFFKGTEPDLWVRTELRLLEKQLPEQVLRDGGHCEQSPMYHTIVLSDLLDLLNVAGAYTDSIPSSTIRLWEETYRSMLRWLDRMCHPDGRTAFFSDGGFTSYEPTAVRENARRLGLDTVAPPVRRLCHLKESGYVRLQAGDTIVLFDVGEIGSQYQPGHGHADTLSIELSHKGHRILVNPGTSTYTDGPERRWQRSTAAHNTVELDGENQSELWSAFRVARRAHPLEVRNEERENAMIVEAAHDGYRRLRQGVIHRRSLELAANLLVVRDTLAGAGHHSANVWFHLHPDLAVHTTHNGFVVDHSHGAITIRFDPLLTGSIQDSTYNPRFGVSLKSLALCGVWSGVCPVSFTTLLELS